jgi:spore coat polysaccharide biosynthesis protein SpsF
MEHKKIIVLTQARLGSTRFPAKVLSKIGSDSLLAIHLRRLKQSALVKTIVVATTLEDGSDEIVAIAQAEGAIAFKGSTDDVLDRFYQAAKIHSTDYVVRVTSDCPLIDAQLMDKVIHLAIANKLDYASNVLIEEYPDGQDVEVIHWSALERAWSDAKLTSEREHVTPYIRKHADFHGGHLFKAKNLPAPFNCNGIRMTVDEPADLEAIRILITALGTDKSWRVYADYIIDHPHEFTNQKIVRNEGYLKSIQREMRK